MKGRFSLVVIDGDITDFLNIETQYLRYENIEWEEVTTLCASAFKQGFQCAVIKQSDESEKGGVEDCET